MAAKLGLGQAEAKSQKLHQGLPGGSVAQARESPSTAFPCALATAGLEVGSLGLELAPMRCRSKETLLTNLEMDH